MNLKQLAEAIRWDFMFAGHDAPTRAWCEKTAKKHAKEARKKAGSKRKDFAAELFRKVRKDKGEQDP